MIYEALIVPSEFPPTPQELKRALLTYDKVILVDPSDRELIPRNTFMRSAFGLPLIGMDTGPVRPLGKTLGYDDRFSRLVSAAHSAVTQGILEVRSTYEQGETNSFTIGAVPTGGYPLDSNVVLWIYRGMASSQDFLASAIHFDLASIMRRLDHSPGFSLHGQADSGINEAPGLPLLMPSSRYADHLVEITQVARSRIASFIKHSGYCEMKSLVPIFSGVQYGQLTKQLLVNAKSLLASVPDDDFWVQRNRVLDLVHDEFMTDDLLDNLTYEQVIRLRTRAWGRQALAREALFKSVFEIADRYGHSPDFDEKAGEVITHYRKESEELIRERANFGFQIKCDIGKGVLGSVGAISGMVSQVESPLASLAATIAVGGVWALDRAKGYLPELSRIRAREAELKRGAGFGLHSFFSAIEKR